MPQSIAPAACAVAASTRPLYRLVLGDAWERLPAPIRRLHDVQTTLHAEGLASVRRGRGLLAKALAGVFGFPHAGQDMPLRVTFTADADGELWRRDFDGRIFASRQYAGRYRNEPVVIERFGPLAFAIAFAVDRDRMELAIRRWTLLGATLPLSWAPIGESYEFVDHDRFGFNVEIALPLIGLIVAYRGYLEPRER